MEKIWRIKNVSATKELKDFLKDDILAHLLASRRVESKADALAFLNPKESGIISPFAFSDMERAVKRIKQAVEKNEHILIWGDFDADGVSATAVLYKIFDKLGANFSHFVPVRETHGHGLNSKELVKIIAKKKLKLLITVDCGISDNAIISMLNGLKIDTIVTDHHRAPEILPDAFAILNPAATGAIKSDVEISKIKSLCDLAGVGVAYKLACALLEEFKLDENIKNELLPLVALGTIADLVPLLGENRSLVALGLEQINKKINKGIAKLFENLHIQNEITARDIAFMLAPRINAAGRLAASDEAFNLLTGEADACLDIAVQKLNHYNTIRQTLCDEVFSQCLEKINEEISKQSAIILFDENWHVGIIGIVASRLVEMFDKPVFLATKNSENKGRCSIRGIRPYNIYEILKQNENLFLGFGGHEFAGGFAFEYKDNCENKHSFEEIKETILKTINEISKEEVCENILEIDFEVDCNGSQNKIDEELIKTLAKLEPYGQGNECPIFCVNKAKLTNFRSIGKEGSHLKFECEKEMPEGNQLFSCVWWKKADFDLPIGTEIDIAFFPKLNIFNGNTTIQLEIVDLKSEIEIRKKESENGIINDIKIYDHRQKSLSMENEGILNKIDDYLSKNPQIKVRAAKFNTIEFLGECNSICANIVDEYSFKDKCEELMFFDYPSTQNNLKDCIEKMKPKKIHLMQEQYNKSPDYYIESVFKMVKFAHNKKAGIVEPEKMANLLGVSVDFIEITLEFLQSTGAVNIIDKNKIELLGATINPKEENFFENGIYEILLEELNSIFEFKEFLSKVESSYFKAV